jgi:hypothetical protein
MPIKPGQKTTVQRFSQNVDIDQRRKDALAMYLKQKPMGVIAQQMGVSIATISKDIAAIREIWRNTNNTNYGELKERELAKVDTLELTYWNAWEASLKVKSKIVKRSTRGKRSETLEASEEQQETYGDPRFLAGIQWCIDKRCDILGLNAPTRNLNLNLSVMSDEELDRELQRYGLHE